MKLYLVYEVDMEWFQLYGVFDSPDGAEALIDGIAEATTVVLKAGVSRCVTPDPVADCKLVTGNKVGEKKVIDGDVTTITICFRYKKKEFYETYTIHKIELNQNLNDEVRTGS